MLEMRIKLFGICCFISVFVELLCKDQTVPTYFRRTNEDGELVNQQGEEYGKDIPSKFVNFISRRDAVSAVMKVSPVIVKNGAQITVSWTGVERPTKKDFVSFYCPHDDPPEKYIDYFWVDHVPNWENGTGVKSLQVFNMRSTCEFRYFRESDPYEKYSQLIVKSNQFGFKNGGDVAPLQGHISSTGNPTEMRIMWVSAKVEEPLVRFGLTKEMDMVQLVHSSSTYNMTDLCEYPANNPKYFRHPGYMYDFFLRDLKPNTRYFYSFGTKEHMSDGFNFTTDLLAGDETPHSWIVYGDMGTGPAPDVTARLLLNEVHENNIRYVVHHGDISYARGTAYIWDQWFALIEPYSTLVPYMVGIGNHEQDHLNGGEKDPSGAEGEGFHPTWGNYEYDSGGECGVPMYYRFHMPDNGNKLWWYSWSYGLVHNVMISTEHDFAPGSRQYLWLEQDLKSVDRDITPWLVVFGHRAMYISEDNSEGDLIVAEWMRRLLEPLLLKYKVDVAFWAHWHVYERTCALNNFTCVDNSQSERSFELRDKKHGVTHITVGSGGRSLDSDRWKVDDWTRFHMADFGYGRVTVQNRTHFRYEFVQNKYAKTVDSVWLVK